MFTGSLGQRFQTQGVSLYQVMTQLVSVGWVVKASGDGSFGNYGAASNIITSGNHVAFGLYNVGAWFRIQQPADSVTGQKREFVFQQGGAGSAFTIRIKYSPNVTGSSGGFTGGAPSATATPSAVDQVMVAGGGTDAAPTYAGWGGTDYNFAFSVVTGDMSEGYAWYCINVQMITAGSTNGMCMAMDVMQPGTYPASDADPCVVYWVNGGNNAFGASDLQAVSRSYAFIGGIAAANWVSVTAAAFSALWPAADGIMGTNDLSTQDEAILVHWTSNQGQYTPPYGTKGYSTLFKFIGQDRPNMTLVRLVANAGGDHMHYKKTLLRWPTGQQPVIP